MGKHNIVISSLPAGVDGTASAVTTALSLLSSLITANPIGLLVGIRDGIARPDEGMDIRKPAESLSLITAVSFSQVK